MNNLIVTRNGTVKTIKLNNVNRKNAMSYQMCTDLIKILQEDAKNDSITVTILSGLGDHFMSGMDFKDFTENSEMYESNVFHDLLVTVANYPKILIAVINGPAIGFGSTLIGLFDIVYASDKATFQTPFLILGLSIEGASSFVLPMTLGRSKASEMLLLCEKMSAQEAEKLGYVAKVVPHECLEEFIQELHKYGELPVNAIKINKKLIVDNYKKFIFGALENERIALSKTIASPEFRDTVKKFMSRKNKL